MNGEEPLAYLVRNAGSWIASQREVHRPNAAPISEQHRDQLSGLFGPPTLDFARIRHVPLIDNPPFYEELGQILLDFRDMAGITYCDTILISDAKVPGGASLSLVFHELVHVVQYAVLGIERFAQQYVVGWAQNDFKYDRIPLEAQAYDLQRRFDAGQLSGVSAETEIRMVLEGQGGSAPSG